MMKILCTADWHIGKKLEGYSRFEEQKIILQQIVDIVKKEQVDAVIIAGDCFDTQNPSPEMTKLFVSILAELSLECLVLVIAGNHDNPLFLSSSEAFASQLGVVILGYPFDVPSLSQQRTQWNVVYSSEGVIEIYFKKSKKTVRFLLSPYANAQRLKKDLGVQDTDKKAWELLCDHWGNVISQDEQVTNILVSHSFLLPEKRELFQDEEPQEDSEERSIVGTLGAISLASLPQGIDYVIAGHIHKPQELYSSKAKAFYTGSPLIYSLSESGQQKSVLMLELGKKNKEYTIPLEQLRDVKKIHFDTFDGMDTILENEKENYLILVWEGEHYFSAEEHQFLRNSHPLILRVESQPKITQQYQPQAIEHLQEQSTEELFQEYFRSKYSQQEAPEDLIDLFRECVSEELSTKVLLKKRGFLPKSLVIKGFYSYKQETTIDFSLLEQKGFFGIFGNTGSGKSALIEAMIVALFYRVERIGKFGATGKGNFSNAYGIMNLDSKDLLIEFIFEITGVSGIEEYKCRVSATRDKKKSTEVKMTREVLLKDQGEWIPSDLTNGEEIVGITYEDFRKTIVLQQQDFLGFISAAPKENTETLMRLFQLERFDLGATVDTLEKNEMLHFSTIQRELQELDSVNEDNIANLVSSKETLSTSLISTQEQLTSTSHKLSQLEQNAQQQEHAKSIKNKFELLQKEHDTYEQAKERLKILPILQWENEKAQYIQRQQQIINQSSIISNDIVLTKEEITKLAISGKEATANYNKIEEQRQEKQQFREQQFNTSIFDSLVSLENRYQQSQRLQNDLQNNQHKLQDIMQNADELSALETRLAKLREEEKTYRDLAGLTTALEYLKEDAPCPLCGSLEHPSPYHREDDNQEVLDSLESESFHLQKQIAQLSHEQSTKDTILQNIDSLQKQLNQILGEDNTIESLNEDIIQLTQKKLAIEEQNIQLKKELDLLNTEYITARNQVDRLKDEHQNMVRKQDQLEREQEYLQKEQKTIESSMQQIISTQESYEKENNLDKDKIALLQNYSQRTENEIQKFFEEYLLCSGELNSLKQIIQSIDLEELQQNITKIKSEYEELNKVYTEGQQQLGYYKTEIERLESLLIHKQKLEEKFNKLATRKTNIEFLKKLFKGSAFVHFIGQKYLAKLCYRANQRFLRFTQNQFELVAPEEFDDKKGKIMVIDRLAGGNKRDMQTLSGGQSFQAALSLALALADESGTGHRFFFVDEGFGTLDHDSLLIVLDSLRDLVFLENRVVGMISHIPMIREEVNAYMQISLDKAQGTLVSFHEI